MKVKKDFSEFEEQIKKYLNQGWKIKRNCPKGYFVLSPLNNSYSLKDFSDEPVYTQYQDENFKKEREFANNLISLIEKVKSDKKFFKEIKKC